MNYSDTYMNLSTLIINFFKRVLIFTFENPKPKPSDVRAAVERR